MVNYWLLTIAPENFKISNEKYNFGVVGLSERYLKTIKKVHPGDKCVFYLNVISKIGAIVTVTSNYYYDNRKIWLGPFDTFPLRIKSKPDFILNENEFLDVKVIRNSLEFISNKKNWQLYFRGSIRQIEHGDYLVIRENMEG